jgi:hypothetical protein
MEADMELAAASSADALEFEELLSKLLQLADFVQRTASPQQLAILSAVHTLVRLRILYIRLLVKDQQLLSQALVFASQAQQWMAVLPVGEEDWLFGLQSMRRVLTTARRITTVIRNKIVEDVQEAQDLLGAAHAVFALPEVERATDLLPELVGLVGEFLAPLHQSGYVSIHALPKQLQQPCASAVEVEGASDSTSLPPQANSSNSSAGTSEEERKEPSTACMDESE